MMNSKFPGIFSMSPALEALLKASSASALVGTTIPPDSEINFFSSDQESGEALSALFAATKIGKSWILIAEANVVISFSVQV